MAFFTILKAVQSTCILTIISLSAMELLELSPNPELIGVSNTKLRCPFACFCDATTNYVSCVSDVHIQVPALPISTSSVFFKGIQHVQKDPELIGVSNTKLRCPFACFCDATTNYVSCVSDVHIQVPALPISTSSVFFKGIQHVQKDAFSCCPHINKIHLSLPLQSLSESAFKGLSNLAFLSITKSNVRELPNAVF